MVNDVSTTADEEMKENRIDEFGRYLQVTREHVNPLVHNKGSPYAIKVEKCFDQEAPTAPSANFKDQPEADGRLSPHSLMCNLHMVKKDTLTTEAAMSNISELNSAERIAKVNNIFQLPLFEIRNTMQALAFKRKMVDIDPESPVNLCAEQKQRLFPCKVPYKSRSMLPGQRESFERLAADLTPKQYNFLKQMYGFKTNYLFHVLNMREIYFQYVTLSREDMTFTGCEAFQSRVKHLLKQSEHFVRDASIPKRIVVNVKQT